MPSPDKMKVLLIEHDPGFSRYVSEMLGQARDLEAEILPAEDLRGGLSALEADHVDVVVMDMSLPDGAGLANVSLLRAEAPQLPIIVAGESDDEAVALEAQPGEAVAPEDLEHGERVPQPRAERGIEQQRKAPVRQVQDDGVELLVGKRADRPRADRKSVV